MANEDQFVNQMLFDGLTVLQHRGQDAAGMVTAERRRLHLRKDNGLVRDVFHTHHMMELRGNVGIGHCRYPTAGSSSCAEAQPLYTNYPHGICVAHNGNVTNTHELSEYMRDVVGRHMNTESDSELLLNLFAEGMTKQKEGKSMTETVFTAVESVMKRCKGGYAGLYLINGVGLVAFRDPHGIRPLVFGCRNSTKVPTDPHTNKRQKTAPLSPDMMGQAPEKSLDYVVASESVVIDTLGFDLVRDVKPGEAIFLDMNTGQCHTQVCHPEPSYSPCIFEYVYFARPDSIMDGVSVYESRLKMGEKLAEKILRVYPDHGIDVVVPIPDTSRTSALQAAYRLNKPFREGFIKNRYIARTFIMPGQETRRKSVRLKLNTIKSEFAGKNVLLVDDSIVRGTTGHEIVQMARDAGAKKVFFTSAAPPIRYPNIYGIDIPTRQELVAYNRNEEEIAKKMGCDWVVYQDLKDLEESITCLVPKDHELKAFDTSCFSGEYVTGEKIDSEYFQKLYALRSDAAKQERTNLPSSASTNSLNLTTKESAQQSNNGCENLFNNKSSGVTAKNGCESLSNNEATR